MEKKGKLGKERQKERKEKGRNYRERKKERER